jgi:cytoskeletal protein CcmA (bactofilin family)
MSAAPSLPSLGVRSPATSAVLGKSVVVKGQILSQEDLVIEGEVEGTIDMVEHRLTIAANGNVRANVKARDLEIMGSMQGQVEAVNKVYIRKGANFVGDIHSAGIVIEDGGYIKGEIDLSRHAADNQNSNGVAKTFPEDSSSDPIRELSDAVSMS